MPHVTSVTSSVCIYMPQGNKYVLEIASGVILASYI